MVSEAQRRAIRKYDRKNTRVFCFKFNKRTDADIIERLNTVSSKQGYVKMLIRDDIKKNF